MRKLLFTMSALAALLMIAPSDGYAQFVYQSMVGLYSDEADLTVVSADFVAGPATLYLVLSMPYFNADSGEGESGTVPVPAVGGYECRVGLPGTYFLTTAAWPTQALNIAALPDMVVGYASPVAVVDEQVTLATLTMFGDGSADVELFLTPITALEPEFPGEMSCVGYVTTDPVNIQAFKMFPTSNAHDAPVFVINGSDPVATEGASWGNVKALYR